MDLSLAVIIFDLCGHVMQIWTFFGSERNINWRWNPRRIAAHSLPTSIIFAPFRCIILQFSRGSFVERRKLAWSDVWVSSEEIKAIIIYTLREDIFARRYFRGRYFRESRLLKLRISRKIFSRIKDRKSISRKIFSRICPKFAKISSAKISSAKISSCENIFL